ncbi:MAG TPA: penicillin-binding protein 2 [Flavisolibacter sp.]|nr:penicillin-binding protein 2 [Flavisolibacter sp.]
MPVFNQSRSYIIRILFLIAFLVILAQLFNLQVVSSKYDKLAQENAVFKKIVYPSRGVVYDRKGKPIVNNTLLYDLMITPAEIRNVDTAYLCQLLQIDTAEFNKRVITAVVKNGRFRPSPFEDLLTPEKHARLEENMWRFGSGFFLQERPVRTYPFSAGAHFMGYIGEADSSIIARSKGFYQPGDYVGRSGLEARYEKVLMGQRGVQYWIKDNKNRLVGRYQNGKSDVTALAGRGLHTYVDVELQQLAEKLMANKVGAVVAIEPKTGGILAMASGPTFNPNDLTGSSFKKTYGKFVLDVSGPLLNRAIKGQYPAGSTFKPVAALIGLDEGVISPKSSIDCRGVYYGCNEPRKCDEKAPGHAASLRLAIAHSCNSFFFMTYRLTVENPRIGNVRAGYEKWRNYVNAFGYGNPLGVDLPSEDKGNIPDTAVYNKTYHNRWNSCTNVTLGIGQDKMLTTPLQIANAMSIIANKGYSYTPHFVKSIDGETTKDTVLNRYRIEHKVPIHISDSLYNLVIEGMHDVTLVGTAASIPKIPGIDICAKTGTAENKKVIDGQVLKLKSHSIFACFAPKENPKIAIAVIVENGGYGSTWAGPIAYLMIEKYLTDSLRADRLKEVDRIASANLMPDYLPRLQFMADSSRAYYYFNLTNDSNYIKKFLHKSQLKNARRDTSVPKQHIVLLHHNDLIENKVKGLTKKKFTILS